MSNPKNILGSFSSYAYHHMLMVCNNTEAAEALVNTSEITTFQHPANSERYKARAIGGNEKLQYITLIDGTSDAHFYITEASWENIIAMDNYVGKGGIPQSTSMSLDGELEIIEPLGAKFLNRLTEACDELSTDPVGLVFILKTIFVGHKDDGSVEMISNIKPLMFINYDITAMFSSSGAQYKMMFVGAVNGIGKLPHTQKIFNGVNLKIQEGENLADTFTRLSTLVTDAATNYKKRAISEYARTLYNAETGVTEEVSYEKAKLFFDVNYRTVEYRIIAPDYADNKYIAGDNEHIRLANKSTAGSFNFGKDIGVEDIIKKLMASSIGVMRDSKDGGDGKKYIYKIVSGLNSSNDDFVIEYVVNRYEVAEMPFETAANGDELSPPPGQAIEFNYIFTGQNVDIKEFDIKMEMGMAFFQIAATTDTMSTQKTVSKGADSQMVYVGGDATGHPSNKKTQRTKTPLFFGSKIKQPMSRNTRNPEEAASFQALLNRHAALENIEAKMTIYGNPQLLDEMQVMPSDLITKKTEKPEAGKTVNPNWLSTPSLVKVNIKMPVDNNDVNTEYEDFWYTGYYTLFGVKQMFSNGEFLQELDMMSLPVSNSLSKSVVIRTDKEERELSKTFDELAGVAPPVTSNVTNDKKTLADHNAGK